MLMNNVWRMYISALLVIILTITDLSNVAGAATSSTREVKVSSGTSVEKSVYSINASISPEISAKVKELKKTVKREAKEFQSENSKHYQLSDGSYIAEVSLGSQYYKDESGNWNQINTSLTDEADLNKFDLPISAEASRSVLDIKQNLKQNLAKKSAHQMNSNYRPLQVPYEATIPKIYGDGYFVKKNSSEIKVIPIGSSSVAGNVYGGNSVYYTDVWNGTDVKLTATNDAVKEDIILKDESSPSEFKFELQGDFSPDKPIEMSDLIVNPSWLLDSNGVRKDVEQRIYWDNGKLYLTMTIEKEGLKYPITVDPTISTFSNFDATTYYHNCSGNSSLPGYIQIVRGMCNYPEGYIEYSTASISISIQNFPTTVEKIQFANLQMKVDGMVFPQTLNLQDNSTGYNASKIVNSGDSLVSLDVTLPVKTAVQNYSPYYWNSVGFTLSTSNISNVIYSFYSNNSSVGLIVGYNVYAPGTTAITAPQNGTIVDSNYNITWNAAIDQDDSQSSLKYHIQLSTNGGSTWSDIVPLTAAGASSYIYNFSSIANTTNAIIRIRAFDGIDYGSWIQSPTFTIKHNTAPNTPTGINPGSTNSATPQLMGTATPALNWTFSDPDAGDTQGQYQVLIYNGTTLIRDSGWVSSAVASYTVPAGTLSRNGTYNWQVRTKDNKGAVSALSALYYIKINNLPIVNVTSYTNGQQVTDNVLTFTWTYSDADGQAQSHYQIQGSQDNWATVAYNSGALSGSATSFTTPPLASGTWSFRITAKDGLEWSAAATRSLILPNAYEPNDTTAQAYPINYSQNYTSLITTAADIDFYKYTATSAGIDKFKLIVPTGLNYDAYVYDASMNLVAAGIRGTSLTEEVIYNVNAGAIYYIKIVGVGGNYSASANYSFSLNRQTTQFTTTYQYDFNGNITGKTVTSTN